MTRLRLPVRLARREVWRRPGRTALVALLVAVPVAGMAMSVVLLRTDHSTTRLEKWERDGGQADAIAFGGPPPPAGADTAVVSADGPIAAVGRGGAAVSGTDLELPDGTRSVTVASAWARIRTTDGHRSEVEVRDLPILDRLTAGIDDLVEGRAATARGEIVLAAQLAGRLHVSVGDDLVLDRPAPARFQVVGLVEPIGCLSCPYALVAPGMIESFPAPQPASEVQLLDLPDDMPAEQVQAWADTQSGMVTTRQSVVDPEHFEPAGGPTYSEADSADSIRWSYVIGALVLTVAGIVISAAFAVGARRQLVTLGQLAASGASPMTVRAALVLQGTVTGLVGAVLGLVLAAAALLFGRDLVERLLDERISAYVARPTDLLVVVAIGVAAATVAALIPARTAARIPTLAALAGRRPLTPVPPRLVLGGVAAFLGGLGLLSLATVGSQSGSSGELWAYVAILGGVGELLGACALAPAIVARLEPLAARVRGSWRLGARTLARHRSRTGAVVSAVAAAGALAIASGGLFLGTEAGNESMQVPDDVVLAREALPSEGPFVATRPATAETAAEIESIIAGARAVTLRGTSLPPATGATRIGGYFHSELRGPGEREGEGYSVEGERAMIADDEVLDLLRASVELREAVADAGLVVLSDGAAGDAQVTLPDGRVVGAVAVPSRHYLGYGSQILISEARAEELGVGVEDIGTAFQADHALTEAERDGLEDVEFEAQSEATRRTELRWEYPRTGPTPFQMELVLTGLALVFSLFVVGLSLALAAAESKDERDILTIAGAPPGALARSAGTRAWLLAAIGGVMAVPVGFLPVVVFARASASSQRFGGFQLIFPTRTAVVLLLAVPAIVAAVAWGSSAAAQRLRPVRVSTATFE